MESCAENFGIEIDFLPVGESSRSGDAICVRWGYNLENRSNRRQYVMVVDGGYSDNGSQIVNHIQTYYNTNNIHIVVNTHPHKDHVNGLAEVFDKCNVSNLVMHQPWDLPSLKDAFHDGRVTSKGIKEDLKEGLESAYGLARVAKSKGTKLLSGFAPCTWADQCGLTIHILGPTKDYYQSLIPAFSATPTDGSQVELGQRVTFSDKMVDADECPLTDVGQTSAENNSGIVLALELPESIGGGIVLLTGDAGIPALENAVLCASSKRLDLPSRIRFFQIPHHGSIQNLGPTVLNSIFGCGRSTAIAYVSVAKEHDNEHPAKHVTNELLKHSVLSYETAGRPICKSFGKCPQRVGWTSLTCIPQYEIVESVTFDD